MNADGFLNDPAARKWRIVAWVVSCFIVQYLSLSLALTGMLPPALLYLVAFCLPVFFWFRLKITPELSPIFSVAAGLFAAMLVCAAWLAIFALVIAPMLKLSFAP